MAQTVKNLGSIPGSGRSGEGNGNPLQYFCLEIPWTEKPGGLQSMGLSGVWYSFHFTGVIFALIICSRNHTDDSCENTKSNVYELFKRRLRFSHSRTTWACMLLFIHRSIFSELLSTSWCAMDRMDPSVLDQKGSRSYRTAVARNSWGELCGHAGFFLSRLDCECLALSVTQCMCWVKPLKWGCVSHVPGQRPQLPGSSGLCPGCPLGAGQEAGWFENSVIQRALQTARAGQRESMVGTWGQRGEGTQAWGPPPRNWVPLWSFPAGSSLPLAGLPVDQAQPEALRPGPWLGQPVSPGQPGRLTGGRGRGHGGEEQTEPLGTLDPASCTQPLSWAGCRSCPARDGGLACRKLAEDSEQQGDRHLALPLRLWRRLRCASCWSSHTHSTEVTSGCAPGRCSTWPAPEGPRVVKH